MESALLSERGLRGRGGESREVAEKLSTLFNLASIFYSVLRQCGPRLQQENEGVGNQNVMALLDGVEERTHHGVRHGLDSLAG